MFEVLFLCFALLCFPVSVFLPLPICCSNTRKTMKSSKEEIKLGWRAGSENIPVFMLIPAIGVNRAWFNAQLFYSTLCLIPLMPLKLHRLSWNHHYSEQTETGWCSGAEQTAAISLKLLATEPLNDLFSQICIRKSPPLCWQWRALDLCHHGSSPKGTKNAFPAWVCMLSFTNHLLFFFNTLGTFQKSRPPLLKFSMFGFWPKVNLGF